MSHGPAPVPPAPDEEFEQSAPLWAASSQTEQAMPGMYVPESRGASRKRMWATSGFVLAVLVALTGVLIAVDNNRASTTAGGHQVGIEQDAPSHTPTASEEPEAPADTAEPEELADPANPDPSDLTPDEQKLLLERLARREADDAVALGDVNAPVVLIEYADMTCPYCAKFAQETFPSIVENYVDKGLVRIEWRDLPLFGDPSAAAALGGRAAAAQGKFWEYQKALFGAQIPRDQVTQQAVTDIAESIGIADMDAFTAGFREQTHFDAITRDYQEARSIGVQSTPTFLINGVAVQGAQPYETFVEIIDEQLALAKDR